MSGPEKQVVAPMPSVDKPTLTDAELAAEIKAYEVHVDKDIALVRETLFGVPKNSAEGKFMKEAWERKHALKGYTEAQERILGAIRKRLNEIKDVVVRMLRERGKTIGEVRTQLEAYSDYLVRTVLVTGQSLKVSNMPYGRSKEAGSQAAGQMLDTKEVVILEHFADSLEEMDLGETVDAMVEDQPIIDMIKEANGQNGDTMEDRLIPGSPKYASNVDTLRDFILQKPTPGGAKRSANRKLFESVMWLQVVRPLGPDQKRDLVKSFLSDPDAQPSKQVYNAKDFIQASILSGAMTREDAMWMFKEDPEIFSRFNSDGKNYSDQLTQAVKFREQAKKEMESAVRQVENPQVRSFVTYYTNIDNLLMSRMMDVGVLTTVLNVGLDIGDAFRMGHGRGTFKNIGIGIADAITDPYVWIGVGTVVGTSNHMFPWVSEALHAPSNKEKEASALTKEAEVLHEIFANHPAVGEHLIKNYENYLRLIDERKYKGEPAVLNPDDVKISALEAGDMGFDGGSAEGTQAQAQGAVLRAFKICTQDFEGLKLDSPTKLADFIHHKVLATHPAEAMIHSSTK